MSWIHYWRPLIVSVVQRTFAILEKLAKRPAGVMISELAETLEMPEHDALELVFRQGFGSSTEFGPNAPKNVRDLLPMLEAARDRGFSMIVEQFAAGMTSMVAPVVRIDGSVIGVVTIAGPMFRLTEERMEELAKPLLHAAKQISDGRRASAHFRER